MMQTDNPFVNAGIFYVQHATRDDAAGWLLDELNRRIERFTYRPESVRELPHSAWSTPPHFANADEQANLNDIVASALILSQRVDLKTRGASRSLASDAGRRLSPSRGFLSTLPLGARRDLRRHASSAADAGSRL